MANNNGPMAITGVNDCFQNKNELNIPTHDVNSTQFYTVFV